MRARGRGLKAEDLRLLGLRLGLDAVEAVEGVGCRL